MGVDLEELGTVLDGLAGVELLARQTSFLAGVEDGGAHWVDLRDIHDLHRTVVAVLVAFAGVGLQLLDQGQDILRGPVIGAQLLPNLQVLCRGVEGNAGVVGGAATEHLGAGVAHERVAVFLLLDRVIPVQAGLEKFGPALQGQDLIKVAVVRAGLEEGNGDVRVLGQAGGDSGTGGTATDDDVIVGITDSH